MNITAKEGITDARQLGTGKYVILGVQHLFAMFGATVLVPVLTGLSVSSTLLFAGVGTLVFHLVSKLQVPAFLGSSFAFLGGYMSVKSLGVEQGMTETLALDYACMGVFFAGLCYFVMAGLIKSFGIDKILKFFPPLVTGPMIIAIGLVLSGSAIQNCTTNWPLALVAVVTVIATSVWGKGIIKIIPILLGVLVSYTVAAVLGEVDFSALNDAAWVGLPFTREQTVLAVFDNMDSTFLISTIIAIVPIAIATIMEHIGDMCAISSTVGKDFLKEPGLHRTLMGDGLATALASLFGAPANTTYGENTGVLNLTKVFDPAVIRLAAGFAILLSFAEGLQIAVRDMDDLVTDIDTVVAIDFLDFVDMDDVGTMDTKELVLGQHFFYRLHRQMGDQRLGLVVEIEQHVVFHAIDVGNLVDGYVAPFAIDADKDGIGLLRLLNDRLLLI